MAYGRDGLMVLTGNDFPDVLAAAQAGEEWAVASLWRAHQPRVLRYLRAHEPVDAEDIAAETWLDVARSFNAFVGDEDAFRGWLFTIARRRLIDHRRRRNRRPSEPVADPQQSATGHAPSAEAAAFAGSLGDDATRRILALLPPEQAEILVLRIVADLSVAQVAEMTGRSPGNVRVFQHRALRRLAATVDDGGNADASSSVE